MSENEQNLPAWAKNAMAKMAENQAAREKNKYAYVKHQRKTILREIRRFLAAGGAKDAHVVQEALRGLRYMSGKIRVEKRNSRRFARPTDSRPTLNDELLRESIETLKSIDAKVTNGTATKEDLEKLTTMRARLCDGVGHHIPDPDIDLFGWLAAVQPRSERIGRIFFLDLITKNQPQDERTPR